MLEGEAGYVALGARDLFELVRGSQVVLDPASPYGKVFLPAEIEGLLDGSTWRAEEGYVAERDTEVLLGQPARYPDELVAALRRLFEKRGDVEAAYLVHFYNPERDEQAHSLVGLEVSGDWGRIVGEAGMVAAGVEVPDPPVDFIELRGGGGDVEAYMRRECEPFFVRQRQ